jgi:hypothetical protein
VDGAWGYLDRAGGLSIAPRFSAAEPFTGGLGLVQVDDGGWGWVDPVGDWVWEPSR